MSHEAVLATRRRRTPWPVLRERLMEEGLEVSVDLNSGQMAVRGHGLSAIEFTDALRRARRISHRRVWPAVVSVFGAAGLFAFLAPAGALPVASNHTSDASSIAAPIAQRAMDCGESATLEAVRVAQSTKASSSEFWFRELVKGVGSHLQLQKVQTVASVGGVSALDVALIQPDCELVLLRINLESSRGEWHLKKITRQLSADG